MSTVATLHAAGLSVTVNGDRLRVEPSSRLTEDLRAYIREYKPAIMAELTAVTRIVTCTACRHFDPRPGAQPDGHCRRYVTETWSAVSFQCAGYSPADPAARALEGRQRKVADMLRANPGLRYAYDVEGATPTGGPSGPVSVMLALRDATGSIITGELTVPGERWNLAAFVAYWNAQGRPS